MCRSIKTLRGLEPPATREDLEAAARQFIRKVSGFHRPSKANEVAFDLAIQQVADAADQLLHSVADSRRRPPNDDSQAGSNLAKQV